MHSSTGTGTITGRTAHRGSRGIALLFLDHGTRRGWGVSVTPRSLFTPGKSRYPLYRRLGGPQGRSGKVRKISPPTGIRSPDRPARSQSLYRRHYPVHVHTLGPLKLFFLRFKINVLTVNLIGHFREVPSEADRSIARSPHCKHTVIRIRTNDPLVRVTQGWGSLNNTTHEIITFITVIFKDVTAGRTGDRGRGCQFQILAGSRSIL